MSRVSVVDEVAASYERIEHDGSDGIFIELIKRDDALDAARRIDPGLPLAGKTVAVKGNIDVAGYQTTAGCPTFGSVATASAPAVAALEAAGAVVVGITNLDQFATGLVGTRSPYGICPNARWPELIAGGSSSGSAVAVARGLVDIGVGTDTAGSGRGPAAANGIVGWKPTRGRISTEGVVPACRSLDCVSIFARTVAEAAEAADIAAGAPSLRFDTRNGVSCGSFLVSETVRKALGPVVDVDPEPFLAAGRLLYGGAFVAERYDAVGEFVESHQADVDPIVRDIILAAGRIPAWQLVRDQLELARLRAMASDIWADIDVLVVPTVPRLPTVAEVLNDPIDTNTALGTYTNFVNLLDLCAVTIPLGPATDDQPPPSITLMAPAGADGLLRGIAATLHTP